MQCDSNAKRERERERGQEWEYSISEGGMQSEAQAGEGERERERNKREGERDGGWRELAFWVECGQPLIKSAGQIRQDSGPDWTPGSRALARLTRGVDGHREGERWRRKGRRIG